jgi:hypothetical protein
LELDTLIYQAVRFPLPSVAMLKKSLPVTFELVISRPVPSVRMKLVM